MGKQKLLFLMQKFKVGKYLCPKTNFTLEFSLIWFDLLTAV